MRFSLLVAGNQGLIVKYVPMPASAICFALVGGGLMVLLHYERTALVAQELPSSTVLRVYYLEY